jgi:hypothetical protein
MLASTVKLAYSVSLLVFSVFKKHKSLSFKVVLQKVIYWLKLGRFIYMLALFLAAFSIYLI